MLPKLDVPYYELELPSTKRIVKYRPFLVKEEKILLMASESNEESEYVKAAKQILTNCILDEDIDVGQLPPFDVEYLFLNLRAKSVNEISEMHYTCNNIISDGDASKTCGHEMKLSINLTEIQVEMPENHSTRIELTDKIGIQMKYPDLNSALGSVNTLDEAMNLIVKSIDFIWDEDEVYSAKDKSEEELLEFIDGLTPTQFKKIEEFFEKSPKLKKDFELKCSKCGFVHTISLNGLSDFF